MDENQFSIFLHALICFSFRHIIKTTISFEHSLIQALFQNSIDVILDHLSFVLNFVVVEHVLLKNHVLLVYMEVNFKWQIFLAV